MTNSNSKIKVIVLTIILAVLGGFGFFVTSQLSSDNYLNPEDSSAVFGGEPEFGYPFVGYLMIELKNGDLGNCGINYLSPRVALTAAHCVENYDELFPNSGEYNYNFEASSLVVANVQSSPGYYWSGSTATAGEKDIAVIVLDERIELEQYAELAKPRVGCNYYIVGYGINEDDIQMDRRGADVCITKLNNERFEIAPEGNFFCNGDSGTGIYEKNSNKLVGIVSSYASYTDCTEGTAYYTTRVDANSSFINQFIDDTREVDASITSGTVNRPPEPTVAEYIVPMVIFGGVILCCVALTVFLSIFIYKQAKKRNENPF